MEEAKSFLHTAAFNAVSQCPTAVPPREYAVVLAQVIKHLCGSFKSGVVGIGNKLSLLGVIVNYLSA